MRNKKVLLLVALLVLSLVFSACAPKKAPEAAGNEPAAPVKDTLVFGYYGDPENFNPYKGTTFNSLIVDTQIYDPLLIYSEYDGLIPVLAESWTISEDGKEYTFKIRSDVKFHNGDVLTPEDVAFSIEQTKLSPYAGMSVVDVVKTEVVGTDSVKVTLSAANAPFLKKIASVLVVNKKAYTEAGENYGQEGAIGTGPYKFSEWKKGSYVKLVRFDEYFKGPAAIKEVTFKPVPDPTTVTAALSKGELDMSPNVMPPDYQVVKDDPKLTLYTKGSTYIFKMLFNFKEKPFNDKRVRQAFNLAINRQSVMMAEREGFGEEAKNYGFPQGVNGYTEEPEALVYENNIEKAKQLLAEAGYPNGFDLTLYGAQYAVKTCEVIQSDLKKIGINVELKIMEGAPYYAVMSRDKTYGFGWWATSNDLLDGDDLYNNFHSKASTNLQNYSNPDVDKLLEEARVIQDETVRAEKYNQAVKLLREDAVYVPLFYEYVAMVTNKDLKGYKLQARTPWDRIYDLSW